MAGADAKANNSSQWKTKSKKEKKGEKDDKKTEEGEKKSLIARLLPKVIIIVVVVVFGGAGFTLARLLAGSPQSQTTGGTEQGQSENMDAEDSEDGSEECWYYHMEPVIANLDVDDVTRYVKASLTLEISSDVDEQEGAAFIDAKKPVLTNWLTVYLASLHLEDIRGDGNLKRIQSQVMDAFNEKLFPDSKPKIKNVLFKEFAVQWV